MSKFSLPLELKYYLLAKRLRSVISGVPNEVKLKVKKDPHLKPIIDKMSMGEFITFVFIISLKDYTVDEVLNELNTGLYGGKLVYTDGYGKENCPNCDGIGHESCEYCDGTGRADCETCDGSGRETCGECDGDGVIDDEGTPCDECQGGGDLTCSDCAGEGVNDCRRCGGDGDFECNECDGTGEIVSSDSLNVWEYTFFTLNPKFIEEFKNPTKDRDYKIIETNERLDVTLKEDDLTIVYMENSDDIMLANFEELEEDYYDDTYILRRFRPVKLDMVKDFLNSPPTTYK